MTLKIKDKNYLDETVFEKILYHEKIWITGIFLCIKDPDPVFSQIRVRVTHKDRIRPDPDTQHCFVRPEAQLDCI